MQVSASQRNRKSAIFLVLILTTLLSGYFLYNSWAKSNQTNPNIETGGRLNLVETDPAKANTDISDSGKLENHSEGEVPSDIGPAVTDEEIQIVSNWMQDNGFEVQVTESLELAQFHNSTYHTMETQDLEKLAETDQVAELVLGSRLFQDGEYERAAPILELSVLRGYAKPILNLSTMFANKALAAVAGTVKMTPSGNPKLTPCFDNLHLEGGAHAETGKLYGNSDTA